MATPEFDHSLKLRAAFPADVVGELRVELAVCEQLPDAFEALLAKLALVGLGVHLPIFLLVVIVPDVTQQVGEFELASLREARVDSRNRSRDPQRFMAVECADQDGSWNIAKHFELISDSKISSASESQRRQALKLEKEEMRYRKDQLALQTNRR